MNNYYTKMRCSCCLHFSGCLNGLRTPCKDFSKFKSNNEYVFNRHKKCPKCIADGDTCGSCAYMDGTLSVSVGWAPELSTYRHAGTESGHAASGAQEPSTGPECKPTESDPTGRKCHEPGAKNDAGKTRWWILPWDIIEGVARVLTKGALKYSENGWQKVPNAKERYFDAMMRHWQKIKNGEYIDGGEFGTHEPHWACFVTNALFLGWILRKEHNDSQCSKYPPAPKGSD